MAKCGNDEPADHTYKMTRGWLLPYLLALDTLDAPEHGFRGHGRWRYWLNACERGSVPEGDIPRVSFTGQPRPDGVRHVQDVLKVYVEKGHWYDDAWLVLVRWLLHGFGRAGFEDDVERIPVDVRNKWYELFNLGVLLQSPVDWSAHVLQGGLPAMKSNGRHKWAKGTGFFATPMDISVMMTEMVFKGVDREGAKIQTVCDPCCGTGSLLLPASNYSLRLYGQDIVYDLCLCADLNAWLWMSWLAFMPPEMDRLFDSLQDKVSPGPSRVRLETDPVKVEATRAYRAGEMGQLDFFAALGMGGGGGTGVRATGQQITRMESIACGPDELRDCLPPLLFQ